MATGVVDDLVMNLSDRTCETESMTQPIMSERCSQSFLSCHNSACPEVDVAMQLGNVNQSTRVCETQGMQMITKTVRVNCESQVRHGNSRRRTKTMFGHILLNDWGDYETCFWR